jgi:peptidoglycan/LPS O-acetylase OafA/YrhL
VNCSRPSNGEKNLDIEFLRAVAIAMTLFQHVEVLFYWRDSLYWEIRRHVDFWTGVDLFFCVSGFVITRSLMLSYPTAAGNDDHLISTGLGWKRTAGAFWIKRAWRLWPAAWLWAVVSILCATFLNRSGIFGEPAKMAWDALAAIVHVANFHWAGCYQGALHRCNFVEASQITTLLPTGWNLVIYWSLSLEEQFYLLAPLLLLACRRRHLALVIALLLLLQAPLARPPLGVLWFFRTDAILLGVGLAWAAQSGFGQLTARRIASARHGLRVAALLLVAALAWLAAAPRAGQPGAVFVIALACAGLVWIAGHDRCVLIAGGPARAALIWLGARSYSLYLTHLVAFFVTREIWFRLGGVDGALQVAMYLATAAVLLVAGSELSYTLVESRLRRRGRRYAARWLSGTGQTAPLTRQEPP